MSAVADLLENNSIYIFLNLRGALPGFHWGIFIPTNNPQGEVWHAVNRSGGWFLENKSTNGTPDPMSLCLVLKLGTVTSEHWAALRSALASVPSSGQPSLNTGEAFSCRVWVRDAVRALHDAGVIQLAKAVESIEAFALETAESHRCYIERGTRAALVLNSTGFSVTA
ncbi:hypothetical protein OPT61_g9347 [Boeremia exigua]|uniref:Uncharacterized protein n=1 Tax=Boeremia exigua TaxID=749465 RepID=A0ACC2HUG9_9PLEO|nr:hypothetical protein OPT61_g9347 [Boeremia exigua]